MKPKRPNLRWKGSAGYYDRGGSPRRWEPLGSDEAVVLRRWQAIYAGAAPARDTVAKMLADYLERPRAPLAPGTLKGYRIFQKHLVDVFGDLAPSALTQGHIVRYLKACPRFSARGEIGLLSLAYVGWIEEGRLSFNPCFGVKVRLPTSKRTRLIRNSEIEAVLEHADERLAVAIELAFATGLRISDLVALRWADVAEHKETLKTGARLGFETSDALDAILARCRALQARVASLYVLCKRGGGQYRPGAIPARWKIACAKAGVVDANWHDLRAAAGTEAERIGQDAQKFLGHRHRQTTEGYLRDRRVSVVKPLTRRRG